MAARISPQRTGKRIRASTGKILCIIYHERTPSSVLDVLSQTPASSWQHDFFERETMTMATTTTFQAEKGNETSEFFKAFFGAFGLSYLSTRRRGKLSTSKRRVGKKDRTFGFYELPCVYVKAMQISCLTNLLRLSRSTLDGRPIFRQCGGEWSDDNTID